MTVDPRVEAAAREVRRVVKGEDVNGWARRVLAAADAVERLVCTFVYCSARWRAARLADALRAAALVVPADSPCVAEVVAALAEWDATQDGAT